MKYKELINHILGNAQVYLKEFRNKEHLTEKEKGLLLGLWMDIDSIKNQLEIENLKIDVNLQQIMDDLQQLIGKE